MGGHLHFPHMKYCDENNVKTDKSLMRQVYNFVDRQIEIVNAVHTNNILY